MAKDTSKGFPMQREKAGHTGITAAALTQRGHLLNHAQEQWQPSDEPDDETPFLC